MRRRGDRQQSTDWLGSLKQPILQARQHIYSISHIAALVSAWRRTCREECSRPISFSLPPLCLSVATTLTLYNKVSGDAIIPTSIQEKKKSKYMFEFQVNENPPTSLKSRVLQSWTGRVEVDNEEDPGRVCGWWGGVGLKGGIFDGCVFSVHS